MSLYFSNLAIANTFKNSPYEVCFTPGEDCTSIIVNAIDQAKKTLLVQAYSFTSAPIAKAVVDAKQRGVFVEVILDKSQFSQKYSSSKFLINHKVPVWNDDTVAIAHNKVMIIDNMKVITGSFNFTKAAENRNAENVLIVSDKNLAKQYTENWETRKQKSEKIN